MAKKDITTKQAPPVIDCDKVHPSFPVTDVLAASAFYQEKLGFTLGFIWGDPPEVAGMNLGHISIHISRGEPNPRGHLVYFVVGDADELFEFQLANGVDIIESPVDRPWDMRDFMVRDPWGNQLVFGHYLPGMGEPIPIERVEVPLRLEKRLAAVIKDLAAFKGMSIDSCMEELILHSFEELPNSEGVASPHDAKTHRYIAELIEKHGIDYDTHGSYRFVE